MRRIAEYRVDTYLFRGRTTDFAPANSHHISRIGALKPRSTSGDERVWLYGIVTVLIALLSGWGAALVFRLPWRGTAFSPPPALRLGFLGLVPAGGSGADFVVCASEHGRLGAIAFSALRGGAAPFLGGVRCGFELMRRAAWHEWLASLVHARPD